MTLRAEGSLAGALPTLRRIFFGGDVLTAETLAHVRRVAPEATCVNFYGATETPQAIAWHPLDAASGTSGVQPLGGVAGPAS